MDNPKHFLMATIDGGGNIPPMFGMAKRLLGQGHRVTVLSEPCLEMVSREAHFNFIPFTDHFTRTDRTRPLIHDWDKNPFTDPTMDDIVFGPAKTVTDQCIRAIRQTNADALIADCLLPPALMAAEHLKIPRAIVFHFPEYLPGSNRPPGVLGLAPGKGWPGKLRDRALGGAFHLFFRKYLPLLNGIRKDLGLPLLKKTFDLLDTADIRLMLTLKEFDFPLDPAPANLRYAGPVLDDPDWVEPWTSPWPADDTRPLVVISFSSTFQDQAASIQNSLDALGQLSVRTLVTTGPAVAPESFRIPSNAVVITSAPHSLVFPHADLVITHAGHGTLMRALASGLPMVCMPMGRDQKDNALKVQHHGCGLRLKPTASPESIRRAAGRLLKEPVFRRRAGELQEGIRRAAKAQLFVDYLERMAQKDLATLSV